MSISKYHLNEYRIKKYMKESPWSKFQRMKELRKLKIRCKNVLPASDQSCPTTALTFLSIGEEQKLKKVSSTFNLLTCISVLALTRASEEN